jgi:hypothetical protein
MAKTEVRCELCNKLFKKENKEINRCRKRGIGNYCSNSCVAKHRNTSMSKIYWKKQYKKHPNFRGYTRQDEYSPFRTFISKGRGSIKKKGCTIDVKYLKTIWEFQNGICPYTGIKMILPKNTLEYNSTKSLKKGSLYRIESSKGYVEGNLEFVCCGINFAKNNFTKKDMTSFLDEIMSSMNALSVTQVQPT